MPTSIIPSFISEIKNKNKDVLSSLLLDLGYRQTSGKHTSEEHSTSPWVAFGRRNLIFDVAHNWFGDFIKSLGTILEKKKKGILKTVTHPGKQTVLIWFLHYCQEFLALSTLFSKLYLLRSLDSVALLSPCVNAPWKMKITQVRRDCSLLPLLVLTHNRRSVWYTLV